MESLDEKLQRMAAECITQTPNLSAFSSQVGGGHYKDMVIQPVEFIHRNGLGFCEGAAIKYLCRWRQKNGLEDLRKARHFIDLLIEMEDGRPT